MTAMADRFPSPFELAVTDGGQGWEALYSYSSLFSEHRRAYERTRSGSWTACTPPR